MLPVLYIGPGESDSATQALESRLRFFIMVGFLYPGQGAQYPGMLHRLPGHARISETLEEASDVLGRNVLDLDTEQALRSTVAVQLGLFISGVAATRALQAEGVFPEVAIGLSIGSFSAAVAAEALAFHDGLFLVKSRAELMEKSYAQGYGLSVVVGLDERQLSQIVDEINGPASEVFLANLNAPRQIVIAGSDGGMKAVLARAKSKGARTCKRLPVSVPSHCALLERAANELSRRIAPIEIKAPERIYVSNRRARALRDPDKIREDLATNIAHPVRWHDSTTVAYELGVRLFVELPPGHTLTDLATEAFPEARSVALEKAGVSAIVKLAGGRR